MNNSFYAFITPYERIFVIRQTRIPPINNNFRKYLDTKKKSQILENTERKLRRTLSFYDKSIVDDIFQ